MSGDCKGGDRGRCCERERRLRFSDWPFREDCAKWDDSAGRKSWESSGCHVQGAKVAAFLVGG